MGRVVIGMDPHKRSATIEVIDEREQVLARGRYGTEVDGYQRMLAAGREFPDRVWAVEGCAGIGRHIAQRLVADGETVLDVPAKLSARVRVFDTGQGPQDRPGRRPQRGRGRPTQPRPAYRIRRRRHRGVAAAGRPPRRTGPGPHRDGRPHPSAATRAHP